MYAKSACQYRLCERYTIHSFLRSLLSTVLGLQEVVFVGASGVEMAGRAGWPWACAWEQTLVQGGNRPEVQTTGAMQDAHGRGSKKPVKGNQAQACSHPIS